jgi:hypothetical protein
LLDQWSRLLPGSYQTKTQYAAQQQSTASRSAMVALGLEKLNFGKLR